MRKHVEIAEYVIKAPGFVAALTSVRKVDATMKFDIQLVMVVILVATPRMLVGNISAHIVQGIVPIPYANSSK